MQAQAQTSDASVLGTAGFGVPSESPDASLLLAWLSRNADIPMGLVLLLPDAPAVPVAAHLTHLLQRLLKERRAAPTCLEPCNKADYVRCGHMITAAVQVYVRRTCLLLAAGGDTDADRHGCGGPFSPAQS